MPGRIVGLAAALSFLVATSASAVAQTSPSSSQQATPSQQQSVKKAPDPNEIVCEKEQDSGSRLVVNKVCMTRSQWAEQRRLNRQDIEKVQVLRPCGNGC